MNASGPNELKVSYICIGNTQFSQYFDTMMSLCCLICTDEITFFLLLIFSSFHPPPPPHPGPRYFFLHLPFSQSSPSPSGPCSPPPFLNLLCRLLFLPFSFLTCLKSVPWHQKKIIHENSDISHPPRRSHCPFRIILFMRMFVRHANIDYGYVINAFL